MNARSHALPEDATLLPLAAGSLLVSPGHAVFCRVPAADERTLRDALFTCFKMEERVGRLTGGASFAQACARARSEVHPATSLPTCAACPLATLCGGGCRSDNLLYSGDADRPVCGPWRERVLGELLAEDRFAAVDWPLRFLAHEARARGIDAPAVAPATRSRHLLDVG